MTTATADSTMPDKASQRDNLSTTTRVLLGANLATVIAVGTYGMSVLKELEARFVPAPTFAAEIKVMQVEQRTEAGALKIAVGNVAERVAAVGSDLREVRNVTAEIPVMKAQLNAEIAALKVQVEGIQKELDRAARDPR